MNLSANIIKILLASALAVFSLRSDIRISGILYKLSKW